MGWIDESRIDGFVKKFLVDRPSVGQKYARLGKIDLRGIQKRGHVGRLPIFKQKTRRERMVIHGPRGEACIGKLARTTKSLAEEEEEPRGAYGRAENFERRQSRPVAFPRSGRARGTRPRSVLPIRSVSTVNGQKFCHDSASPPVASHRAP